MKPRPISMPPPGAHFTSPLTSAAMQALHEHEGESPEELPVHDEPHEHEDDPPESSVTFVTPDPRRRSLPPKLPRRGVTLPGSDPTCIPSITMDRKRTVVLCFDGTGDQFDADITNVAKIFSMLKKDDKNHQVCYYQAGIGTQLNRHVSLPGMKTFYKSLDSAVGSLLSTHVQEGYEFLMQNHVAGDKVCLFGFSRGAYTARALAGMLHKVGLLPADNRQQIPYAWRMYKDTSKKGWNLSRQFKDNFCTDVNVEFIGVFDTVSSIGFIGRKLPFTGSNYGIRYFRHAMALDERRARFKVNHWSRVRDHDEKGAGKREKHVRPGHEDDWTEPDDIETDVKEVWFAGGHCDVGGGNVSNDEKYVAANIPLRWMVRETFRCDTGILWDIAQVKRFTGLTPGMLFPEVIVPLPSTNDVLVNGDGKMNGDADNHEHHKHWYDGHGVHGNPFGHGHGHGHIRHHSRWNTVSTGTIFTVPDEDEDTGSGSGSTVSPITERSKPEAKPQRSLSRRISTRFIRKGKEKLLDGHEHVHGMRVYDDDDPELRDAYSKLFDQLSISPVWWVLEFFPVKGRKHVEEDLWKEHYFINLGKGRVVPKLSRGMYIHRSVKLRLKKGDYKTKAIYDQEPTWVL